MQGLDLDTATMAQKKDHLAKERKDPSFDVHAMTSLIYGGQVSAVCL